MILKLAEKYRKPDITIKEVGNGYYLYSAISKTVEEKIIQSPSRTIWRGLPKMV